MSSRVSVNEVGLRDGLQNQPRQVPLPAKLDLARALVAAGIRSIEATSFVSPTAVPQMADAAELIPALPRPAGIVYSALVPNLKGYERAVAAGVDHIALVLAATETLNQKNINMSLEQATTVCLEVTQRARADGIYVRGYVAAACGCPYEGAVDPKRVIRLAEAFFAAGANEVAIADTIGAGNPSQVSELFGALSGHVDIGAIAGHFHDTRGLASALAWAAMQKGVRKFDSSIGGLGGCPFAPGAAGNLATEDLVFLLHKSGFATGIDMAKLMAAVTVAEMVTGQALGGRIRRWWDSRTPEQRMAVMEA